MDHETALIAAFIVPSKRERLVELLRNPKRRRKVLDSLHHFNDLDPRFVVDICPADQHALAICALLTGRGAPAQCHVISSDAELDGRDVPLVYALQRIVGFGEGSLVSCIPGRLGYFEGEGPKDRYILDRSVTESSGPASAR